MKRLDSICLVVLKGLGSFNGFFSFLCLVLGFLNVNLYSFFLLIKKMVLLMMLNINLLKSLPLHRGPLEMYGISSKLLALGPVVRRPISTNLGLNFNLEFFVFCSKAFSPIIFSILCLASNHQIEAQKKTEISF